RVRVRERACVQRGRDAPVFCPAARTWIANIPMGQMSAPLTKSGGRKSVTTVARKVGEMSDHSEQRRAAALEIAEEWFSKPLPGSEADLASRIAAEFAPLLSGLDLLPCGHRKADWVQFPPSADTFGGALDKGYCSSCQREAAAVSAALEQAAAIVQEDADAIRDVDDAQAAHYEQDVQEILALPRNSSALDVERAKAKADAYERCAQEADADKDSVTFRKWRD